MRIISIPRGRASGNSLIKQNLFAQRCEVEVDSVIVEGWSGSDILGDVIYAMWLSVSNINIQNSTISNCEGGAIRVGDCEGTISNNIFSNNYYLGHQYDYGGGLYVSKSASDTTSLVIAKNTIIGNIARHGGGLYISNTASDMLSIVIMNNTIFGNIADNSRFGNGNGGGIYISDSSNPPLFINNIVWGNTADHNSQIYGPVTASYCDVEGGYEGEGNIDLYPEFVDTSQGNFRLQYSSQDSSPCIDAGHPASQYNDPEDPNNPGYALYPAMGTVRNDMGAYGGPGIVLCGSKGDADGNGSVNVLDLIVIVNNILGVDLLSGCRFWRADCTADDTINILDVIGTANVILGIGTCPPGGILKVVTPEAVIWGLVDKLDHPAKNHSEETALVNFEEEQRAKSLDLPIFIDSETEVTGAQFRISYNSELLTPGKSQLANRCSGISLASHVMDGVLTIVVYSPEGNVIPSGTGSILTLMFEMLDSRNQMADVDIDLQEVILAGEGCQAIPVKVMPINLKASHLPKEYALHQNYPNPFNPMTMLEYQIPIDCKVTLNIYNILGQKVRSLLEEQQVAGYYTTQWDSKNEDGGNVASGIYCYRIQAGDFIKTKKMLLLK